MAPRKRGRDGRFTSDTLTGGTGDVKPQWLIINIPAAAGLDDYSVVETSIPRIILGQRDRATIMEILRVDWYPMIADIQDVQRTVSCFLSTRLVRAQDSTTSLGLFANDQASQLSFAGVVINRNVVTTGGSSVTLPMSIDTTDGAGNGMLIATDSIFSTVGALDNAAVSVSGVHILYRMTDVGITEYVGIVQSQL